MLTNEMIQAMKNASYVEFRNDSMAAIFQQKDLNGVTFTTDVVDIPCESYFPVGKQNKFDLFATKSASETYSLYHDVFATMVNFLREGDEITIVWDIGGVDPIPSDKNYSHTTVTLFVQVSRMLKTKTKEMTFMIDTLIVR